MEISIPESLFDKFKIIIKYQNTLLLKEISKIKGWNFTELKKEFLKEEDIETLIKKYKKKINKKKKKNNKKKKKNNKEPKLEEPNVEEPKLEEPNLEEPKLEEPNVEEPKLEEPNVEEPKLEEPKTKRKKKIKKIVKTIEIKCHKYIFEKNVFYINIENDNAYDKNMEFVGKMFGNGIDFNANESQN